MSGRVPHRVDAATKAALLGLLDDAVERGWTLRRACRELELGEVRAHRWIARCAIGELADKAPGGSPMHGLLDAEAAEILALFEEWGETDRSHRKRALTAAGCIRIWTGPLAGCGGGASRRWRPRDSSRRLRMRSREHRNIVGSKANSDREARVTIDVFVFRGAGEAQGPPVLPLPPGRTTQLYKPSGLLTSITDNLHSHKYACYEVAWPASVGPFPGGDPGAPSLETSVDMGVAAAAQAIIETPNVAGLISYSLGGICASRLLEEVHAGKHKNVDGSDLEIDFVVNIANPMRRDGESVNGLCGSGSFGLHGQRGDWPALDVREYANPGSFALRKIEDIITNSPADSPLRLINAGVSPFSLIEGARLGNVGNVLFDQLIAFLNSDPPHNFERFHRAFIGVLSYLERPPNGAHVCYPFVNMLGQSETWTNHAVDYLNNR